VWANGVSPLEARNSSSTITAQYFSLGQTISGTSYYYFKDHVPSICGTTNSAGTIQAQYAYDPYGQVTKIAGSGPDSDFQYAGYYYHSRSGLNLTLNRAYNASLGRWINRDPIEEAGGINLYAYVDNDPVDSVDISGLATCSTYPFKLPLPTLIPSIHPVNDPNNDNNNPPGGDNGGGGGDNGGGDDDDDPDDSPLGQLAKAIAKAFGGKKSDRGRRPTNIYPYQTRIPKGKYFRGPKITNDVAKQMKLDRIRLSDNLHELKKDAGLRAADNVIINIDTGDVYNPANNVNIGNIYF